MYEVMSLKRTWPTLQDIRSVIKDVQVLGVGESIENILKTVKTVENSGRRGENAQISVIRMDFEEIIPINRPIAFRNQALLGFFNILIFLIV